MRVLFAGTEGEYSRALQDRGNDTSFSLFFYAGDLAAGADCGQFDAVLVSAVQFLRNSLKCQPAVIIVYGPLSLMAESFEAGCDDYIREPLGLEELSARVSARAGTVLHIPGSPVWLASCKLEGPEGSVRLSTGACKVLTLLVRNHDAPVPRAVLEMAMGTERGVGTARPRSVDMTVSRIRQAFRTVGASGLASALRCADGSYRLARPVRLPQAPCATRD